MAQGSNKRFVNRGLTARWAGAVLVQGLAASLLLIGCGSNVDGEGASEEERESDAALGGREGSDSGTGGFGSAGGSDAGEADTADECQGELCDDVCVNLQTSSKNCGDCGASCMDGELCSEGECVTPSDKVVPWGEAASTDWADPASAPNGLIMTEDLDAKLKIEEELALETGGETAGFLHLDDGEMVFKQDPRPYDIELESVWHTHPGGTSFSPYDIGNWGAGEDWGQWATVRGAYGHTYVLLRTAASPTGLSEDQLVSENDGIRSDIFDFMIQEFGHDTDVEASHWSVFEMARRYHWVYYLGTPGSLILERVTTDGPTNETDVPGGYPASVLD